MIGTITIEEVLDMISGDSPEEGRVSEELSAKRQHDEYPEILDSVRRHGVQSPVLIRYDTLCNGHHRVAACIDLGIESIPFTDDPEIGWANEFEWPEEKEACRD
jgi:hypothetical protein